MGASESTAKTNGTTGDDDGNSQPESGGSGSNGSGKAGLALAAAGVAAWGISRMLSENTDSQQNDGHHGMGASESTAKTNGTTGDDDGNSQPESGGSGSNGSGKAGLALAAAGVAAAGVAAWGISRMLSENTDSQQNDGHHGMEPLLVNSGPSVHNFKGIRERSNWSPRLFKIHTDGRCHSLPGELYECPQEVPNDRVERKSSGYGGILRDHRGNWVRGFRGYLVKKTDCFTAELHGIHKGLKLVEKFRHNGAILESDHTILESDCKAAVDWINDIEKDPSTSTKSEIVRGSSVIIEECRDLARNNNTTINHIPGKNANQCAHKLADLAILKKDVYVEFENPPDEIKHLACC